MNSLLRIGFWTVITDPDTQRELAEARKHSLGVRVRIGVMTADVSVARDTGLKALRSFSHRHGPAFVYDLDAYWAFVVRLDTAPPQALLAGVLNKKLGQRAIQTEIDQRLANIFHGGQT